MNNKIELLRSLWFDDENSPDIMGSDFKQSEKDLIKQFKRGYELGSEEFYKFVQMLNQFAEDEDDYYPVFYFKSVCKRGPLAKQYEGFSEAVSSTEKNNNLKDFSDNMGIIGIPNYQFENGVHFPDMECALGCTPSIHNKLPDFIKDKLKENMEVVEGVYQNCSNFLVEIENTLPIKDKDNQRRYGKEKDGSLIIDARAHGNYLLKDRWFYGQVLKIQKDIEEKVKNYLTDTRFKMLKQIREYNPFEKEKNESMASRPIGDSSSGGGEQTVSVKEKINNVVYDLDIFKDILNTKKITTQETDISNGEILSTTIGQIKR